MGTIWELDYYSRPIVDDNNKKLWELLVCETPTTTNIDPTDLFQYAETCSSTEVNSGWLRQALERAIAKAPQPPQKIRFFRRPMNNMIVKACGELNIIAQPSRRTYHLNQWIEQRLVEVYPQYPNYQAGTTPAIRYEQAPPSRLPDALQGEQWALVSLAATDFDEMPEWDIAFREAFPLSMMGVPRDCRIPGLIVFSSRATPMAGWMSGVEPAYLELQMGANPCLVLQTGEVDSWVLASLRDAQTQAEGKGFQTALAASAGVHFIAIQNSPQSEAFAGFWFLQHPDFVRQPGDTAA